MRMQDIKGCAETVLVRWPWFYGRLLRVRKPVNLEKLTFLGLVCRGDFVLEGGANIGVWTTLFGALVGRAGRVLAFEPVPATFDRLSNRLQGRSTRERITVVRAALSDADGEIAIIVPGDDSAQASLRRQSEGSWRKTDAIRSFACPSWRGDDYLARENLGVPDFIKLDVEGSELPALRGFERVLEAGQPLLHLEVCADWQRGFDYAPADLVSFLALRGYDVFGVVEDGRIRMIDPGSAGAVESLNEGSPNLIAGVAARHEQRLEKLRSMLR